MKDITAEQVRGMKVVVLDGDWAILHHDEADIYYLGHVPCSRSWCPCGSCSGAQRPGGRCCQCRKEPPENLLMALKLMKWK